MRLGGVGYTCRQPPFLTRLMTIITSSYHKLFILQSHEENLIVSQLSHCSVVYEDRTLQSNENKDELPAVQWVTLYENRFSLQCDRKCLFLSRAAYLKRLIVCSPHRQHQQMQQV